MFNHNHTFVFEISDSDDALYCNQTIKTEVPGDVTLLKYAMPSNAI